MTLTETINNSESRWGIATTSIALGNGFTVNSGGQFTATVDAGAIPKRRAENGSEPRISMRQAMPAEPQLSASFIGSVVHVDYAITHDAIVVFRAYNARGEMISKINVGRREGGYYSEDYHLPPRAAGAYFISMEAGKLRLPKMKIKL
jgi:hypothetical protein